MPSSRETPSRAPSSSQPCGGGVQEQEQGRRRRPDNNKVGLGHRRRNSSWSPSPVVAGSPPPRGGVGYEYSIGKILCAVRFERSTDFFGGRKVPRSGAGGWFLGARGATTRRNEEEGATTTTHNKNKNVATAATTAQEEDGTVTVDFRDGSGVVRLEPSPSGLRDLREQLVDGARCLVFDDAPAVSTLEGEPDVYCQLEPTQLSPGDLVYGRFQDGLRWYRGRIQAVTTAAPGATTRTTTTEDGGVSASSSSSSWLCNIAYDDGDRETGVPFGPGHHGNVRKVVAPDPAPLAWLDGLTIRLPSKRCRAALAGTLKVKSGVVEILYVDARGGTIREKRAVSVIVQKVLEDAWATSKVVALPWPTFPPTPSRRDGHRRGETPSSKRDDKAAPAANDENRHGVRNGRSGRPPLHNVFGIEPSAPDKGGESSPARGGNQVTSSPPSTRRHISMTPPPPTPAPAAQSGSAAARDSPTPSFGKRPHVEPASRATPTNSSAQKNGRDNDDDDASNDDVVEVSPPRKRRAADDSGAAAPTDAPAPTLRRSHRAISRPTNYGECDGDDDDEDEDFDFLDLVASTRLTTGTSNTTVKEERKLAASGDELASRPAQRRSQASKGLARQPAVEANRMPPRRSQKRTEPTPSHNPIEDNPTRSEAKLKEGNTNVDDDDEHAVPDMCAPYAPKLVTAPASASAVPREMPLADAHKLINALVSQSSKWSSDLGIVSYDVHRLILPTEQLTRLVQALLTGPTSSETPFPDGAIMDHCVVHLNRYMSSGSEQTQILTRCLFDQWEVCLGQRLTRLEYCAPGDEARLNGDAFLRRAQSLHLNLCCAEIVSTLLQHGVGECMNSPDALESHPMVRALLRHPNGLKGPLEMAVASAAQLWVFNGVFKVGDRNLTERSPSLPPQLAPPSEVQLWATKSNANHLLATAGEICTYLAWLYGTEERLQPALVARVMVNSFKRVLDQHSSFDPTPFLSANSSREEFVSSIKLQFVMSLGRDLVPQLRPCVVQGLGIAKIWNWIRR